MNQVSIKKQAFYKNLKVAMFDSQVNHPFSGLKWHKLKVVLRNTRLLPQTISHPISIFQAIIKAVSFAAESKDEPLVFFHLKDKKHTYRMFEHEQIPLEIFFFKRDLKFAELWREVLKVYLSDPVSGGNFEISEIGEIEERNYNLVEKESGISEKKGEICLEFLSPFPFKRENGRDRTYISKSAFIKSFEKRFLRLFGKEILYESQNDDFSILPYYWNYTEITHRAKSQPGQTQYIKGCAGKFYIKGVFRNFLPFLVMGAELHIGSKISNSQGYYRLLLKDSSAYFQNYFPDKKAILSSVLDVLERYDEAEEALSEIEGFGPDKEKFAEKIADEIRNNTYLPSSNTAFAIKKKDGTERIVEKLNFKDLVVQQYLAKTISKVFERIFEESSIGFRKRISGKKALDFVRSAVFEKYRYAIQGSVENVFLSVNLEKLIGQIDFYLPQNDARLKDAIVKVVRNGYVLSGAFKKRESGLAESSPLSPILADLYLDPFDKEMKCFGAKIIRSGSDFIILAHSKEEAEKMFSLIEAALEKMFLKVKRVD